MSFQDSLAFGAIGEGLIAQYLIRRGWSILPVYEKEIPSNVSKGPRFLIPHGELIAPDCLAFRKGVARWVEAKHKKTFTWHRKTGQWTTGIDIAAYSHYLEIRHRHDFELWLLFLHLESTPDPRDVRYQCPPIAPVGLFGGEITKLAKTENHRHENWGRSGMVYWSADKLQLLATAEDVITAQFETPARLPAGREGGVSNQTRTGAGRC